MANIVSTATALPPHCIERADAKAALCARFAGRSQDVRLLTELIDAAEVETRYSVIPIEQVMAPRPLEQTRILFEHHAVELAAQAARGCLAAAGESVRAVDTLITVSCTGVLLPSLGAVLAGKLDLRPDIVRIPMTELGCAGGAAAVARAADFATAHPEALILVVAVELPSLNLQVKDSAPSNLVATAIFGDGAAAVLVRDDSREHAASVRIIASSSHLEPGTLGTLRFNLHGDGFHAVLGRELPDLVAGTLPRLVSTLTRRSDRSVSWYVLHAAGKKILAAVERALELRRDDVASSWEVLHRYGNQSSASVLFVLDSRLRNAPPPPGAVGLMAAFGPGVATELVLLSC